MEAAHGQDFNTLSTKISQLSIARSENDRKIIEKTLAELNSFNFKYPVVTNPVKAVLLINQCCSLIPSEDTELVLKCCHLITNLVTRQNVTVEGRTLQVAVLWCLHSLKGQNTDIDIFLALDALLRNNMGHDLIIEVARSQNLLKFATDETNAELAFFALQCLEACTIPLEDCKSNDKHPNEFQKLFEIFLNYVLRNNLKTDKLINVKLYIVCLRGLQNIIRQKTDLLSQNLGIILGVIKSYMLLEITEFIKPQKLMPSPLSIPETTATPNREKGGKMMKHRKPKTQAAIMKHKQTENWDYSYTPAVNLNEETASSFVKTSDSDFSDTEGGNAAKLAVITGRLRQAALSLLLHTIKLTDKTTMFSFWSSFIPADPLINRHNLITCVLKETSNRGRMAALNALLLMLSSSKFYLSQAEKGECLAFTPFSVILGLTIKELHRCLSLALTSQSIPVLTMVLKCFAALVQATPYHRLSPGLITKVIRNVKPFVYHKDCTVQVTALIVLGCILASEPTIPETKDNLIKIEESSPSWLLERCLLNLGLNLDGVLIETNVPTPVKLESLQIISVMSRSYFDCLLAPSLRLITKALNISLGSKYSDVQLHAGRAVDFLGQAMSRLNFTFIEFWQSLLDGNLISLLQNEKQAILRAVGCDCLGSISDATFELLPRDKQIFCVTLLFACSRDEENSVKGAAVRALAICVLHPSLREDCGFVVDTTETIYRMLQDENFMVRVKASWALGNLSDALVMNKENEQFMDEFPEILTIKLVKIAIKLANENDKIKMNTVRALGNLLQLINKSEIAEGVDVLVKCCMSGSNMKVRWNSAYALGNAMKNPALFKFPLHEKIFSCLCDLVVNFRNFKVRINSALALAAPEKRYFYKKHFHAIWISLIKGLETAQNIEDFNEYRHRDTLIEQICLTLAHLMTLITVEDLNLIKDTVHSEHLKMEMKRVWEKLVPEKATKLMDAYKSLKTIEIGSLTTEQKTVVQGLIEIMKQEI